MGDSFRESIATMGKNLASNIGGQISQLMYDGDDDYNEEYEEEEDAEAEAGEEKDKGTGGTESDPSASFLDSIELNCVDTCGPEVSPSLSKLVDRFLSEKMDEAAYKKKDDLYKRPKNIANTQVPRINKPIWDSLHKGAKMSDSDMQRIQGNFLKSALPVTQVIGTLLDVRGNPDKDLDIDALITTLTDSLAFTGAANVDMINKRKAMIKKELPADIKGLANQSDFSATNLFGDDLNANIKEVGELNKISNQFSRNNNRGFRGKSGPRRYGRYRMRRGVPYQRGGFSGKDFGKKSLNRKGPSKD